MQCPNCKSPAGHRSRSRSRWERWRKEITGKRPYRCDQCGQRWWAPDEDLPPSDYDVRDKAPVSDVDLDALDRAVQDNNTK